MEIKYLKHFYFFFKKIKIKNQATLKQFYFDKVVLINNQKKNILIFMIMKIFKTKIEIM